MKIANDSKVLGKNLLALLGLALVIYFPLFLHLDSLPVAVWDESLFALRALHLFEEGSYMYNFNFFTDLPNHQNTKLPFTTFFQVLGYKIFGVNELGLRLPIVFLFLAMAAYLFYYFNRYFSHWGPALFFLLILVASPGFVQPHMLRTGDQDVPFAMYLLLCILFFYQYLKQQRPGFVWAFALAFLAALMTKNLLAGIIGPGLLLYVIFQGKLKWLFSRPEWYGALLLIAGVYAGSLWYFETQNPGFINRMWNYELMGRYQETIEGHVGGPLFYLREVRDGLGVFFWPAALSPLLLYTRTTAPRRKNLVLILWLSMLSYGCILSFSETKTAWYSAPLYTGFALLSAVFLWHLYRRLFQHRPLKWKVACSVICILIYALTYFDTVSANYHPKPSQKGEKYGPFLERLERSGSPHKELTITDNNFGTTAFFYTKMYNRKSPDFQLHYQRNVDFQPGQKVMTCLNNVLQPLRSQYEYEVLEQFDGCELVLIKEKKDGKPEN